MKPWEFEWHRATKQPAPAHGIKVKKAGTTWWGRHWLDALEAVLRGDAGRLARGRSYARTGRAHDLTVANGRVTAQVTGSRPTPYTVHIELRAFDDAAWTRAVAALAEKAQFAAELLAGHMPAAIDDVFRAAGTSLFPRERADLVTSCSCPDSGDPCKHVAATHYVLGEALDRDPFLLFELRGKTKAEVLAALRAARTNEPTPARSRRPKQQHEPKAEPARVSAETYDQLPAALPALHFTFDEPAAHAAMLKQLGAPAAWQGAQSLPDALGPLLRAASETARRIAQSEPTAPESTAKARARYRSSSAKKQRSKRASRAR